MNKLGLRVPTVLRQMPRNPRSLALVFQSRPPSTENLSSATLAAVQWLVDAQKNSQPHDGGISAFYDVSSGWASSYPEVSGYLLPTIWRNRNAGVNVEDCLSKLIHFLKTVQQSDGGYLGGTCAQPSKSSVAFNTGQVLLGMSDYLQHGGPASLLESAEAAAEWMIRHQDASGEWPSDSLRGYVGPKAYDVHAAIGVLKFAQLTKESRFEAGAAQALNAALSYQSPNGWVENCDLLKPAQPSTHYLGYYLRGLVEYYLNEPSPKLGRGIDRMLEAFADIHQSHQGIPGRFDREWKPTCRQMCVPGSLQIAESAALYGKACGEAHHVEFAQSIIRPLSP